jgi:hypothetical protein
MSTYAQAPAAYEAPTNGTELVLAYNHLADALRDLPDPALCA